MEGGTPPSIRMLSDELRTRLITTKSAYEELERARIIENIVVRDVL